MEFSEKILHLLPVLGIDKLSPLKSNSPSNLSHCSWMIITFLSSASGLLTSIVSGMIFATTMQAIGVPFCIHMRMSLSTETHWLPILYLVKIGQTWASLETGGSSHLSSSAITFILVLHRTSCMCPFTIVLQQGGRYSILAVCMISLYDKRS